MKKGAPWNLGSLLVLAILFFPFVAANGLISQNSTILVNKTVGNQVVVKATITNQEPFTFFNLTLESNPYVSAPSVDKLDSGQAVAMDFIVNTDESLTKELRVKGLYFTTIGMQFATHFVNVTAFQSSPCSFSIVKGDTVVWTNSMQSTANLRSQNGTPVDGATSVASGQNFSIQYSEPGEHSYRWHVGSWGFSEICTITVLNDSGYVNDPNLDAKLRFVITTTHPPTTVSIAATPLNFSMRFFDAREGSVIVTNAGGAEAKKVHLLGDWMDFSSNDFDLPVGQSKPVIFTIRPRIVNTNQTNRTHTLNLSVSGNFPASSLQVQAFVEHAEISGNGSLETPDDIITYLCNRYPHLCSPEAKVVYRYVDNGTLMATLNITDEQWRDWNLRQMEQEEEIRSVFTYMKEVGDKVDTYGNSTNSRVKLMEENIFQMRQNLDSSRTGFVIAVITIALVASSIVVFLLIMFYKKKEKERKLDHWEYERSPA